MKIGDIVICRCVVDTWYKGVPGIVVEHGRFSTKVLIKSEIIELNPSSLEVV